MNNENFVFKDEVSSKYAAFISESNSDKLYNSIVRIDINNF